ncbi:MAG: hypothetical protein ABII22_00295 [Candidatus Micrarchaeota archaeon]
MLDFETFIRKYIVMLILINASVFLFAFYTGMWVIGIAVFLLVNGLFYMAFGKEGEELYEPSKPDQETLALRKDDEEIMNENENLKTHLSDVNRRIYDEFENEFRKVPIEERTDKKAHEIMNAVKRRYGRGD